MLRFQLGANLADQVALLAQRANLIVVEGQLGPADGLASFRRTLHRDQEPRATYPQQLSRRGRTRRAAKLAK
jgi:hypothetical protein